ncbi:hypothetical protein AGMMS50267_12030 [Spirochaetia bacterium]|nr:hypothetical protein AGMMS50267_12030 [Spirochaetia bacterium]
MGSKFQARLFGYFIVTVIFAAVPVTLITTQSVYVMVRFWQSMHLEKALEDSGALAMENYFLQLEKCDGLIQKRQNDIGILMRSWDDLGDGTDWREELPRGIHRHIGVDEMGDLGEDFAAVQEFWQSPGGIWRKGTFAGNGDLELEGPPALQRGFAPREMPRDQDVIRYVLHPPLPPNRGNFTGLIRVVSYELGAGFDDTVEAIGNELVRFDLIDRLGSNMRPLLIFYYMMFFFPPLLMTAIIAISFTRRVTQPIVELTEATRRVAEGDFSIQILSRPGDELGTLISTFNAMVQDLEKSQNALIKAEKISIWQDIAQQLAHEIKNPLTPIKLSAERVLRRWRNEPERIGEILESSMLAVVQEVEGLAAMLTEFRTLARPIEPSQTWTMLKEAVEKIIEPYHASYPKVQFEVAHIEAGLAVKMDQRHITQVLANLIINAIDAMNGEGTIEIRTDLVKKRERRYCRLSVRDTGKGISEAEQQRVFVPYFTTKESGTGLGLPIIERIITDHGGSIWLNSAEGVGSTFFIDFPLDDVPGNLVS